jgi:hypothetical protein
MDDVVKTLSARMAKAGADERQARPSREEAEAAVRTLIRWAGDDPAREGLVETPQRVARAFEELYAGYAGDPSAILNRVFEEVEGYGDVVLVKDIPFGRRSAPRGILPCHPTSRFRQPRARPSSRRAAASRPGSARTVWSPVSRPTRRAAKSSWSPT